MAVAAQDVWTKRRYHEPSQAVIEKRRLLEKERHDRIFDPKTRQIGIDKAALDAQVQEKARLQQLEQQRDEFYASQALAMDQHALFLAGQSEIATRHVAKDVEQYRQKFQKKQARQEWDLSDPKRNINSLPARVADDDPRCGLASIQVWLGSRFKVGCMLFDCGCIFGTHICRT